MSRNSRKLIRDYMEIKRGKKSIVDYAKMIELLTYIITIESRNDGYADMGSFDEYADIESFDEEIYNILSDIFTWDRYTNYSPSYFEQCLKVIISFDKYQEIVNDDERLSPFFGSKKVVNNKFWRDIYNEVSESVIETLREIKSRIKDDIYNGTNNYKKIESILNQYESRVTKTMLPSSFTPSIYVGDQWFEIDKIYRIYEESSDVGGGGFPFYSSEDSYIKLFLFEVTSNGKKETLIAANDRYEDMLERYNNIIEDDGWNLYHDDYSLYEEHVEYSLYKFMNEYRISRDILDLFMSINKIEPFATSEEIKINYLEHSFDEFFQREVDFESGIMTASLVKILDLEEDFSIDIYKLEDVMKKFKGFSESSFENILKHSDKIYDNTISH